MLALCAQPLSIRYIPKSKHFERLCKWISYVATPKYNHQAQVTWYIVPTFFIVLCLCSPWICSNGCICLWSFRIWQNIGKKKAKKSNRTTNIYFIHDPPLLQCNQIIQTLKFEYSCRPIIEMIHNIHAL